MAPLFLFGCRPKLASHKKGACKYDQMASHKKGACKDDLKGVYIVN
jgi:hypothetical protein